jgi:murein DD-endopeptidase MepM/ murein hydrolase activator NlpD
LPHVYRGRAHKRWRDLYDSDHADAREGGRFRWLLSTFLAGAVGTLAIFVVIYGSSDQHDSTGGLVPTLKRMRDTASRPAQTIEPRRDGGLNWSVPRTDRLQLATGTNSTRFIIHETLKQRRNGREYLHAKPYARIVARLAPVPPNSEFADVIPPFNPFKLYSTGRTVSADDEDTAEGGSERGDVAIKVVELLGGILPGEDGQELDTAEVADIVERTGDQKAVAEGPGAVLPEVPGAARGKLEQEPLPPNTTELSKTTADNEEAGDDLERSEVRVVKAGRGDTLVKILTKTGSDVWQARAMAETAKSVFPDGSLTAGQEVHVTLVPSLTQANRLEPSRFTVFDDGHIHRVTVARNAAGEFTASATPLGDSIAAKAALSDSDQPQSSSVYSSLYHATLMQNVPPETIGQILRIHAYDTDFRRRIRAGDAIEFFFDMKDEGVANGPPGELLFTSITVGGETSRFWRFRTPDGVVDYYDEQGNNSRKFLMRRPVRSEEVRLTSGFGIRFHPLLNERKMHTGVDWSAPIGTPIMAAGNGVIEEAGRKGYNGNYIRIRHANGYQTAYSHLSRFAQGTVDGARVRQGQIIGYVGSTGLSSGPHLHYEVLVNSRFVDPLSIQVPRDRQLTGKQLADFQKDRVRIDELMRRAPVMQASR